MPPKAAKKGKGLKAPPEKEYDALTLDDMKAKEQKCSNRLSDLRICLNFIDEAIQEIADMNEKQLIIDKWEEYLSCNPIPKPYIPPDIRIFFEKMKYFQGESIDDNIDWLLGIDERSILSQDIFRVDLSRVCLNEKTKPNFGYEYNEYINNSLAALKRIEYFLDNEVEVLKCPRDILIDIEELKKTVQVHVSDFFDRFTYRILCSEEAYMVPINALSCEYCFSGDNFRMHLWALKNVPIRFTHLDEPRLIANFHEINLRLHIPSTMLRLNLSIRGILMNFDHCSENAKSFFQEITLPTEDLNAGIQDLHECLINEWMMLIDIQTRIRNEMMQKRLDYEEKVRLFEEEEAKSKKKGSPDDEKEKKKQPKIVKPTKEPPIITSDFFPDVTQDFLEEEQRQYEFFMNTIYNPESLNLDADEINLKRFFILGGVYQLQYVQKPMHTDFTSDSFNMTWHENEGKLYVHHDMYIPATPKFLSRRTTRLMSQQNLRRMSVSKFQLETEERKDSSDPECPWFVMTFILPDYLCYWGEPIVCHYESITKEVEVEEEETVVEVIKHKKHHRGAPKRSSDSNSLAPSLKSAPESDTGQDLKELQYFPYLTPYEGDTRTSILKHKRYDNTLGRRPSNYFRTSVSLRLDLSKHDGKSARDADGTLNVYDFVLSLLLNKTQIRHLERHCLPRIISSFKFPQEQYEEEVEEYRNRPKGIGGTLLRKATGDAAPNDQTTHRAFAYNEHQNNPERLFAIYEDSEPLRILNQLVEDIKLTETPMEPASFHQLINLLSFIKEKYRVRVRRTLDLRPFRPRVKLENKRVKQLAKKRSLAQLLAKQEEERKALDRRTTYRARADELKSIIPAAETEAPKPEETKAPETVKVEISIKEPEYVTYNHWTTRHIMRSEYDKDKRTVVVQTDRLGFIGFAFKRYEHFPFKHWNLQPSEEDPDNEIIFTLDTQYVRCVLSCTADGIKGYVTEPAKKFIRNPKMYLIIDKPMQDFTAFKKMFKDRYLNIFAEHDASFYLENGYFSEKHLATEMHTYCCMAIHSTQTKFTFSQWNRLAQRRDIVMKFMQYKDLPENLVEIRITPEEAFFVDITELCSDNLDIIKLHYTPTWRNIGTYTDLHHLIQSMYPTATELRCRNPKLISCIRGLLNEIRPLSYS